MFQRNLASTVCLIAGATLIAALPSRAGGEAASGSPTFSRSAELAGAETAMLPTLFPSSHASNLLLLHNGDLLCFWFSGSDEGQSNVGIVFSRLPKGANTWTPAQLIDRDPAESYQNPVPFEAPDGTIWLLHTQQSAGKGQGDAQVLKVVSHDGGKTWSQPEVLFGKPGAYDRQPIVLGDQGEWLLPMYYSTAAGITKGADTNYTAVQVSRDAGRTWQETRVPESEGLVQMSMVRLAHGRYAAFFRSRYADFIYRSTSTDGIKWSAPKPTVLPNNNASIQAAKLTNGHLVIAFDNSRGPKPGKVPQTGPRVPLSLAISEDAGVTWDYVRDLEVPATAASPGKANGPEVLHLPRGQEYSYPSVLQMPDGKIVTTYTFRRLGIKAVRVDEDWVRKGTTIGVYRPEKAR